MSEFFKPEKYKSEFQAAVEERRKRPIIDVETIRRKNEKNEEEEVNILDVGGVKVESLASREDILETLKEIHPTPETLELLQAMAQTFQQRRGLIVEGPTSRGKTYLMDKFTELMFGRRTEPIDFYCNGQTDTMSLMAKWVPETDNQEDKEKWKKWARSFEGRLKLRSIIKMTQESELTKPEEIINTFVSLVEEAGISLEKVSGWSFQYGALPRAMTLPKDPDKPISKDNPPRGMFLHIQEVGLAETQVIDALLQLGGKKGKLAKSIQLWEDGGRKVESGEYFWIYYSTNPPENYPNRQAIDQALARRNTFFKLGEEAPSSREFQQYLDDNVPYEEIPLELRQEIERRLVEKIIPLEIGSKYNSDEYLEVRKLCTEMRVDLHEKLRAMMKDDADMRRTKQKFELTNDDWNMVIDFMRKFASPDLEATLDKAIYLHYVSRFSDTGKEKAWDLWEKIKESKNFKERLEKVLPEEKAVKNIEKLAELQEFKNSLGKHLEELERDIEKNCQLE